MIAIGFDMRIRELDARHPKGFSGGYADIERALKGAGFRRIQGSLFVTDDGDFAALLRAVSNLQALPWFGPSVRDIRAFRVENWSDLTPEFKPRSP